MIPKFPKFKKLEIDDFHAIEKFTRQFPPYNDFEFASLWSYNTLGANLISLLNDNLVIKIQDFITGDFFYSFLGYNHIKDTIEILINRSKKENLGNKLFLVPEINFSQTDSLQKYFLIQEDPNSFDYILSVDEIAKLKGKKYYDKRNLVNRFEKFYKNHIVKDLDLSNKATQQEIESLFYVWEKRKGKQRSETAIELTAVKKLFELTNILKILANGVYYNNQLIGFTTYHKVHKEYAIMTFEKGDTFYEGIYAFLNHQAAKNLQKLGCIYLNYEQDLGIPGLKRAKMLWRPIFFLKKYTIEELK
jgi:uncharacterized protein